MGWNSLHIVKDDPLFKYFRDGEYVYYVHSFLRQKLRGQHAGNLPIRQCGGDRRCAAGQCLGTQFHPEKSGDAGLRLLRAFAEL